MSGTDQCWRGARQSNEKGSKVIGQEIGQGQRSHRAATLVDMS